MRAFLHLVFFSGYAGLAAAAVVYAPRVLPWFDSVLAYGLGGLILVGGGLLHEVFARAQSSADLRRRLASADRAGDERDEELDWLRREVRILRAALDSAGESGDPKSGGRAIDEVMAEVKVLKSLMERLSLRPAAGAGAAAVRDTAESDPSADDGTVLSQGPGALPPVAADLSPEAVLEVVRDALRHDRVDLVLQPIVSLPQRKRRFYECFSRLRTSDGAMILPAQYIPVAEGAGLISAVDDMLLFRCVQLIRRIQRKNQNLDFFCNISPHTLADKEFFGDFIDFLEKNRELAAHLVFEFAQGDFARWSEVGAGLLERLSRLGCRFSIDQVKDLDFDAAALAARQVSFVKVDSELLLAALAEDSGFQRALLRNQIDLIVAKIENENRLVELLDYGIDFGQGYLFGAPRLARPTASGRPFSNPSARGTRKAS